MRESLVGAVQGEVTKETFKAVCKPVGKSLKTFAKAKGLKVSQPSFKNRNPKNAPNPVQSEASRKMQADEKFVSAWGREPLKGPITFCRIDVQKALPELSWSQSVATRVC